MNSEVNSTQKPVAYVVTPFRIVPDGSYENGPDELVFAEDASDYVEKTGIPLYARPVATAPVDDVQLALIGRRHFNGPAPQAWYAAARELLASTLAAPEPSYLEYLDLQNHSLRRAIHAMMAKLVFLLDEDQFADIDAIALAAGVTPAAPGIDHLHSVMNALSRNISDAYEKACQSGDERMQTVQNARQSLLNTIREALPTADASPKG